LKIVLLGPAPPYRGGISLFALSLANELTRQGHEVYFLNFKSQYPRFIFPGKEQTDSSLSAGGLPNQRILVPWLPWTWLNSVKAIRAIAPDFVLVSWFLPFFAPAFSFILAFTKRSKRIIIAHNVAPHEKWPLAKALTLFTFNQAERIILLSKATYSELQMIGSNSLLRRAVLGFHPITQILLSKNAASNEALQPKSNVLLFFGLIKAYKGLDILLQAMPNVIAAFPDTILRIAGEVYGSVQPYEELINALNIRQNLNVSFDYISDPEIPLLFEGVSLCILPYKTASQSGVIATSYSYGVPVIATDVGGLGEYVLPGKTGYLVPPNDPRALADAIIGHLSAQPDFQSHIRDYISGMSWEKLVQLVLAT